MSIPKPVQLLMAALQAENPDVIITVIEEPTAAGYYHVRVAHDVVTNLTAAFGQYDGLRVFSSTAYDKFTAIHVQYLPPAITATDELPAEPMFLTEILNKYQDGSLADENDARLTDAQTTMSELYEAMNKAGETTFKPKINTWTSVSIEQVATIEQFITRTLNARYGCND